MRLLHLAALGLWLGAAFFGYGLVWLSFRGDDAHALALRRRLQPLLALEHVALAVALLSGLVLMRASHFTWAHPRWFAVKLGLVAFLLLPLEGMHAYISHVWVARGLRQTAAPPFSQDLNRGLGIDGILRTLAAVLLTVALPLMVWLSVVRPF